GAGGRVDRSDELRATATIRHLAEHLPARVRQLRNVVAQHRQRRLRRIPAGEAAIDGGSALLAVDQWWVLPEDALGSTGRATLVCVQAVEGRRIRAEVVKDGQRVPGEPICPGDRLLPRCDPNRF